MARICKCKRCEKELINAEDKHKVSGKNYCTDCYSIVKREADDYKQLIQYLCMLCETDKPSSIQLKMIKNLHTNNKYPYSAITYTLWYMKDIENVFNPKYSLSNVQDYYNKAFEFYNEQVKRSKKVQESNEIKIKRAVYRNNKRQKVNVINLDEIATSK